MLWLLYNTSTPVKYCDILYTVKSHRNPNRTTNTEYNNGQDSNNGLDSRLRSCKYRDEC